ncbi:ABC transporter ATP-binding protein [Staphylococcus auricularis]|uniref:ABC transporter ATP-binding protein n=1 Tax=Staphylococcus auricularis TaxID=29379 RepID=UPI00242DA143|nr:ABC transporter ATP-binding protein [Staphylococcus auricularis]
MIEFKNVTKRYGDKVAVDDVNFRIKEGEFFVLIGPSGCGKTTTLKMINRLVSLTTGYIYFKDKPISNYPVYEMRWDIGYVLQQIALFPHMTVRDNIAQVPQMKKWKDKDIDARIDELLNMVGLEPEYYKKRKPDELSGGQCQRIGVARALAADPPVILMDEPFSALDPLSREKLQNDLLELQAQIKKTIVFVTHDIQEAVKLGDRICLLNEGHIEQIDTVENFAKHPKNDFVKTFMGEAIHSDQDQRQLATVLDDTLRVEENDEQYPEVESTDSLQKAYQLLAEHEAVIVRKSDQLYQVSRAALLRFLADNEAGDVT